MSWSINEEKNTSREIDQSEVNNFAMNNEHEEDRKYSSSAEISDEENAGVFAATESIDVMVQDAFSHVHNEISSNRLLEKIQQLLFKLK